MTDTSQQIQNTSTQVANTIATRLAYVNDIATSSRTAAASSIDQLLAKISSISATEPSITDDTTFIDLPDSVTFDDVNVPDLGEMDFGDLTLDDFVDVVVPSLPTMPTVYEAGELTVYDELEIPDSELLIDDLVYVADFSTQIEAVLKDIIESGVSGLSTTVEQAIYDRAVSRKTAETEAAYREVENYWASRGFSMPPGVMAGRILEIQQEANRSLTDINNDILRMQGELAFKGTYEALSRAVEFEKVKRDAYSGEIANLIAKAKAKADNLMTKSTLMLEARKARIANEVAASDDTVKRYSLCIESLKGVLTQLQANVAVYQAKSQVYMTNIQAVVEKWKAEALKVTTEIDAKTKVNQMRAILAELSMKQSELTTNTYLAKYKAMNDKYAQLIGASVEAIKAVGVVYAQIASGALSAVHAGVSMSMSGSASGAVSSSYSESDIDQKQQILSA